MSRCRLCGGKGRIVIYDAGVAGYNVAACTCPHGQDWRHKGQLRAWASLQDPQPNEIGRLEEFYTEEQIRVLKTVWHGEEAKRGTGTS
jgi:hypothetical protein